MARNLLKTMALGTALLVSGSALLQADSQDKKEPITVGNTFLEMKVGDFNNDGKTDFLVKWVGNVNSQITIMYMESRSDGKYVTYTFEGKDKGQVKIEEMANLPKELRDYLNSKK